MFCKDSIEITSSVFLLGTNLSWLILCTPVLFEAFGRTDLNKQIANNNSCYYFFSMYKETLIFRY